MSEIKLPPHRVLSYLSRAFGQQQLPYYNDRDMIDAIKADREQAQARIAALEARIAEQAAERADMLKTICEQQDEIESLREREEERAEQAASNTVIVPLPTPPKGDE